MAEVAAAAVALLLYPGLAAVFVVGLAGRWADAGAGADLRRLLRRPPLTVLAAALLAALAASQAGAPFNPLSSVDRNLLVAAAAVGAAAALGLDAGWGRRAPLLLLGLAAWTVALLVPAVLAQDVHPGVLASLASGPAVALKAAAAVVYLGGGAVLITAAGGDVRPWLWLPLAALFASVFVPPAGDDAAGALAFGGAAGGALALLFAGALMARRMLAAQLR